MAKAKDADNSDLAYADTLWKAADALRSQVDAAEYKHVVLGLLFLKYISDSFEARRDELKKELTAEKSLRSSTTACWKIAMSIPPIAFFGFRRKPVGKICKTKPRSPTSPN